MKSIFGLLFLFSFLFSQPIVNINSNTSNITEFKLSYFIDTTKRLTFIDIKSMEFIEGENKDTLGAEVTNTWIKIKLFNTTKNKQTLFLHQDLAYTFFKIHYFEVDQNSNILNTKKINTYSKDAKNQMNGADTIFKFSLNPRENKTIYINLTTPAYHFYNFLIFSEKNSTEYLVYQKVDGVLFVGLLIALAIYNLFIYLSSRYKEYLYYSLYLLSATIWIFYMYGTLAHYFHIYGLIPFKFNFALMFIPIFLALFVQSIFETKNLYKIEHKVLNIMMLVLFFNFIYGLIDFAQAMQLLSLVLNFTLVVFLWISISIYKKGNKIIKIFLLAHLFYLVFNVYALLFYLGLVNFTFISSHGIGVGIIIEALMLSYLVSYKFKIIEQEKNRSQLLLLEKSKMADMGEMIGNIAHQWRQPLATIGISSGILRERKLLNRLSDNNFEEELNHIDSNILHMSQTVEDFLTYYRPNKIKEKFYILDSVNKALLIIGNTLYKNEIESIINVDEKEEIFGFKEEFIQVIISIISNSIYALKDKKTKTIKITSKNEKGTIIVEIQDNGGGIKNDLLPKIFEPYFTTKHQTHGTGLGLYISKNIIKNSMNGNLRVENTTDGAKFSITI